MLTDADPNIMLSSDTRVITRAPTSEGETYAPTGSPTPQPTISPTVLPDVYLGPILCGESKTGDTRLLRNILGGPGNDAIYNFTVTVPSSSFQFDTCASQLVDTFVRIYNADGVQIRYGDDDGGCAWRTILQVYNLDPGECASAPLGNAASALGAC